MVHRSQNGKKVKIKRKPLLLKFFLFNSLVLAYRV